VPGVRDTALEAFDAVAGAPIGIAVLDRELRFLHVNRWIAEANGVPAEAHVGRTLRELLPDVHEPVATIESRVQSVLETGDSCTFPVVAARRPDGARREWIATCFPLLGASGDVRGACVVLVDVTADRERAAAQARARAEAERLARRLVYLQDVIAERSAGKDPEAVAQMVVERARRHVGAISAIFRVVRGGALELLVASAEPDVPTPSRSVPLDARLPVTAALSLGEPVWLESRDAIDARFPDAIPAHDRTRAIAVLPFGFHPGPVGTLAFVFDRTRAFDVDDRALFVGVADQCAQAVERALLHAGERSAHAAAQRATERLARLQAITAALSGASTADDVAQHLADGAHGVLGAQHAVVYLVESDRATLRLGAAAGRAQACRDGLERIPLSHRLPPAGAARTGEACWLETRDAVRAAFPEVRELVPYGDDIGAMAALPLRARGEVLGALGFAFDEERTFGTEERELLSSVADQGAQALDRARLLDAEREARAVAQHAAERLARLQEITAALSAARTPAEIAATVAERAHEVVGAAVSVCYALEPDGSHLQLLDSRGADAELVSRFARVPVTAPYPVCTAVATGEPVWRETREEVNDGYPAIAVLGDGHRREAVTALPLRARGRVIGALGFTFERFHRFDAAERNFLLAVAEQCGIALDRARLLEDERRAREDAERARSEADRARALLDAMVENAPLGIGFFDREFRFQRVNPRLAEMNGLPAEAHAGRTPRELLPGLPMDDVEAAWRRVLETGEAMTDVEVRGETLTGSGRRVWLESWYPVRAGREMIGVGALVRDVTKEREAEEFQRHVVGVVGHDLRNPLSAIVMATRLLGRAGLDAADARVVERIATSAGRIEEIVRALLDFARVRAGVGVPLRRRPCDLAEVARAVAEECALAYPGRQIRCEGEGECRGDWDADRIGQLLTNLVSNALDYSPEDAPVRIRWRAHAAEVVVEVANAGPPIPPEIAPRLFEPFRRGDGRRGGGLGLGLFIARAIATAHDGTIDVRSSADEGTAFSVRLPRR
jgi:PAS domain S-box-containing protein